LNILTPLPPLAALLLCACSQAPQRDSRAATSGVQDTNVAHRLYRIDDVDSLPRAAGVFAPQLWVTLPTYLPQDDVTAIAGRVRDSVAHVHSDLWSLELRFETPGTETRETRQVARFVWGPDGERDLFGKRTAPRTWSSRYNPPTRDSVLASLSNYGHSFGDERASVVRRLGSPQRVETRVAASGADSVFVLVYRGASFGGSVRNSDRLEMLSTIRLWAPAAGFPSVFSIGGTSQSSLIKMLGAADYGPQTVADSTVLSYQWFGPDSELIEFYVVHDTLRLVRWRFRMG